MSLSTVEAAKEIRESLKAAGIKRSQVSVRSHLYSLGSTIRVKVKDPNLDLLVVQKVAAGYRRVHRDERTGDILSGGNRFVDVVYDRDALVERSKRFLPWIVRAKNRLHDLEAESGEPARTNLLLAKIEDGPDASDLRGLFLGRCDHHPGTYRVWGEFYGKHVDVLGYDASALAEGLAIQ